MSQNGLWAAWWERWDRFQETYVPGRELQFQLIADYLALLLPGETPGVLDLCSGPGSFASRILRARSRARVVAVDCDPWALELGRRAAPRGNAITWVDADLRTAWTGALPSTSFDAVVATTAMQWFTDDEVAGIYGDVASLLVSGGTFLTSDHVPAGSAEARNLAVAATERWRDRAVASPAGEHWADFWAAARAEPAFAELLEERARRLAGRHPLPSRPIEFHETALREAGFAEVSEVWRHGESVILLGQRGG